MNQFSILRGSVGHHSPMLPLRLPCLGPLIRQVWPAIIKPIPSHYEVIFDANEGEKRFIGSLPVNYFIIPSVFPGLWHALFRGKIRILPIRGFARRADPSSGL
ncbi:Uncharacterized protein HZ326_20117 [Fusarium oxysporum f. sp. albedinis]|nr:Uncharacterized protein HZ326_20117 [Fusarium oxysporum f. sp. albedinis]